jgi:hypothetical protein
VSAAWVLAGLAALATAIATLRRIHRINAAAVAAFQRRVRTVDQVMDDLRRWRADRRMREAREDITTCNAIYALPTIPHQRKETGQ